MVNWFFYNDYDANYMVLSCMKACGLITLGILHVVCGLLSIGAAIYIFKNWKYDTTWCNVYTLRVHDYEYPTYYDDNDDVYNNDNNYSYWGYCNYRAWVIIELIGAVLWFVAAFGPLYYVMSGRLRAYQSMLQEKINEEINVTSVTNAIELGTMSNNQQPQQAQAVATTTINHHDATTAPVAMAPARIITEVDPITNTATGAKIVTAIPTTTSHP